MSKKLLSALCAAFVFAGCDKPTPPPPPVARAAPPPIRPQPQPPPSPIAVAPGPIDAGLADELVLAHDAPTVDHLARAQALVSEGDFKGAFTESRRALFSSPTDEETLALVARLARRTGQPRLAAEAFGRLAAITPDDATPVIQQARALVAAKDHAAAVKCGRDAIRRDEGNVEAWQITGLAQLGQGDLAQAIASFQKVVELEPNHGWALNNLGFSYLRANENERAVEVLERAAELLPTVAYVHNNLGVALERTGRAEEAKTAYQQAMDLSPKYVKARINAARVAKAQPSDDDIDESASPPEDVHPMPEPE